MNEKISKAMLISKIYDIKHNIRSWQAFCIIVKMSLKKLKNSLEC